MARKDDLIVEMQKLGIEGLHSDMTVKELKGIYAKFKSDKLKEAKGKEKKEELKEDSKEIKKIAMQVTKKGITVPEDCREIRPEDVVADKVLGKVYTVVFKDGPKIHYNVDTHKRIR